MYDNSLHRTVLSTVYLKNQQNNQVNQEPCFMSVKIASALTHISFFFKDKLVFQLIPTPTKNENL